MEAKNDELEGEAMSIVMGGFIDEQSGRRYLPIVQEPTDAQVDEAVSFYASCEGVLEIKHEPEPDLGPYGLTMCAQKEGLFLKNGNWLYLLLLGQYEADGDVRVRTLHNKEFPPGLAVHMGESYPSRARTRDLVLVRSIFKEFAKTGDVSVSVMF